MTLASVKNKTYILLLVAMVTAFAYWKLLMANFVGDEITNGVGIPSILSPFLLFGLFKLKDVKGISVKPIAFGMAVCAGIFLGSVSGILERGTPGLVIQTILATFVTTFSVVYLYKNKYIKVNNKFLHFTVFIFNSILWLIFINFVLSFVILGWESLLSGSSTTVIFIDLLVMVLGYLVFSIDLNIIDQKIQLNDVSKNQVWNFAIELLLDIAWIYLAILFFIARMRGKKS